MNKALIVIFIILSILSISAFIIVLTNNCKRERFFSLGKLFKDAKKTGQDVKNWGEKTGEDVSNKGKDVANWGEKTGKGFSGAISNIGNLTQQTATTVVNWAQQTGTTVGKWAQQTGKDLVVDQCDGTVEGSAKTTCDFAWMDWWPKNREEYEKLYCEKNFIDRQEIQELEEYKRELDEYIKEIDKLIEELENSIEEIPSFPPSPEIPSPGERPGNIPGERP